MMVMMVMMMALREVKSDNDDNVGFVIQRDQNMILMMVVALNKTFLYENTILKTEFVFH